jgi:hypothetical protein
MISSNKPIQKVETDPKSMYPSYTTETILNTLKVIIITRISKYSNYSLQVQDTIGLYVIFACSPTKCNGNRQAVDCLVLKKG